jgi:hemerythrin-like domain-containing protein
VKLHVPIDHTIKGSGVAELMLENSVARAQQEHELLKQELRNIYEQACIVRNVPEDRRLNREIGQLHDIVKLFMRHWSAHTQWEDSELFPHAASYLGAEPDLFTLMEQEYELAEQYIRKFLQALDKSNLPMNREEARKIASYLIQAYAVLNNRFREEEEIMLELAERSKAY